MRRHRIAMMLAPVGIGVADNPPPFPFAHPDHVHYARTFLPFIEQGYSDDEAWAALFSDEQRLSVFRDVHGNRQGKRKSQSQPSLFAAVGGSGTGGPAGPVEGRS